MVSGSTFSCRWYSVAVFALAGSKQVIWKIQVSKRKLINSSMETGVILCHLVSILQTSCNNTMDRLMILLTEMLCPMCCI